MKTLKKLLLPVVTAGVLLSTKPAISQSLNRLETNFSKENYLNNKINVDELNIPRIKNPEWVALAGLSLAAIIQNINTDDYRHGFGGFMTLKEEQWEIRNQGADSGAHFFATYLLKKFLTSNGKNESYSNILTYIGMGCVGELLEYPGISRRDLLFNFLGLTADNLKLKFDFYVSTKNSSSFPNEYSPFRNQVGISIGKIGDNNIIFSFYWEGKELLRRKPGELIRITNY